jgi:hypothetical protein
LRALGYQPVDSLFPKLAKVEGGFDTRFDSYAADLPSVHSLTRADYAETVRLFADRTDTVTGAYVASSWQSIPRLELMTGLRTDVYASQHRSRPTLEPRTTLAYSPIERLRLSTSHGIAHQTPAYAVPLPALAIPGLRGGLQRSLQSSVTAEVAGPFGVTGGLTAFQGIFTNLSDFVLLQSDFPLKPSKPVQGESVGLEVSLKRPIRKAWGMMVSYTLSRSTREEDGRPTRLSSYDRTHVFNAALLFDLGKGFNVGLRTLLYTGLLRDPERSDVSTERLPSFARVDVRFSKRWKWGKSGWVGFVIEALNATASRETVALRCDADGCQPRIIGPLTVPSVSIEGGM